LEAVCAYQRGPRLFDTASSSEDAGRALARAGRRQEAATVLHQAVDSYEGLGAARAASRVNALLRSLGVRRGRARKPRRPSVGWESLTDSELAVVRLVAEGLTNRQIGERLFVSRRTVETHLAHVFAKLGVATRTQVAAEASRRQG
jgi:DNA-binding CsgD family transcriptional regulator